MTDLASLHKTARGLILGLRDGMERLEKAENSGQRGAAAVLARDLQPRLADLVRVSQQLDGAWRMHAVREAGGGGSGRDLWKRKVEQVSEEVVALRLDLERHTHRERRRAAADAAREELLEGRSSTAAWAAAADADAAAETSIRNSKRVLEETFATGAAVLGAMAGQRERLKSAKRKALDVLHGLGLSDSLLRVIERRQKLDAWLAYGGMAVVSGILFAAWWWLKR